MRSNTPRHVSVLDKAFRFSAALLVPIVQAAEEAAQEKKQNEQQ
jgi:hypothetical protein